MIVLCNGVRWESILGETPKWFEVPYGTSINMVFTLSNLIYVDHISTDPTGNWCVEKPI